MLLGKDDKMKVVLFAINGSWAHSNLAIRCLREPLERRGFEVVLLERTLRDRTAHTLEALWRENGDVYGFSCYIWNVREMLSLAKDLHQLHPSCKIVFGGPEASFATERFEKCDFVDCVICGEGEKAFPLLCEQIRNGVPFARVWKAEKSDDVMKSEGILYREGEETGGIVYYESSRGCPYSCAYCLSSASVGVRMKQTEQVLTDLLGFEKISCKTVKFVDRTFNADIERANRIWRALLDERYTKCYHFEVCASLLNEESFEILACFPKGKIQLEFGLQSTNPQTLAAVSRHIRPDEVIMAVRRIYEMRNIHVHLDLIAGLPYESYERFGRSFDAAYGSCDMLQLGFLKLLYGTRLREHMEEYGYVCLSEAPYTVLQSKWMSYAEMQRLSRIAEIRERYDESCRFVHTVWYVMRRVSSPFQFWEGLSLYLEAKDARPIQKISQPDAYRYLLTYVQERYPDIDALALKEMLCADFSEFENKNPPWFLLTETHRNCGSVTK